MRKGILALCVVGFTAFSSQAQVTQLGGTITGGPNDGTGVGLAVSADGSTLAVGDRFYAVPGGGQDGGRVRIFSQDNGSWVPKGQPLQQAASIDYWAGSSVDLSANGNTIMVGVPRLPRNPAIPIGSDNAGGALIYRYNGSSWSQQGVSNNPSSMGLQAYYGRKSVLGDNAGNFIHYSSFTTQDDRGSVRSYFRNSSTGNFFQYGWISANSMGSVVGASAGDWVGYAIDANVNNALAIGAPQLGASAGNGYVEVREYDGATSSWILKGSRIVGPSSLSGFGASVEISQDGNTLIAGAHRHNGPGTDRGYAACYEWDGTDWVMKGSPFIGENDDDRLGFGTCINNTGDVIAVASHLNDVAGVDAGAVKVYTWDGSDWVQVGNTIFGNSAGDRFGYTLSMDGDVLAVGAQGGSYVETYRISMTSVGTYEINEMIIPTASVYPNPASDEIHIASGRGITEVTLTDLTGQLIYRNELANAFDAHVDVAHLEAGMYVLTLQFDNGKTQVDKVLVK